MPRGKAIDSLTLEELIERHKKLTETRDKAANELKEVEKRRTQLEREERLNALTLKAQKEPNKENVDALIDALSEAGITTVETTSDKAPAGETKNTDSIPAVETSVSESSAEEVEDDSSTSEGSQNG